MHRLEEASSGEVRRPRASLRSIAGELSKAPSCRRIVFVLDREGAVVRESKAASTAEALKSLATHKTETGRMAPILFHGLNQLGLPVVCAWSGQALIPADRADRLVAFSSSIQQ
jgi:hypothetical protein